MSRCREKGNTRSRRGNDEIRGELPSTKPLKANEVGAVQEITPERGSFLEEADGMSHLRAGTTVGARCQGGCVGRGGHRGWGRTRNGGRGRRGQGYRILNLPKQGALHSLRLRSKTEFSVLVVPKDRTDILGGDTEGFRLAASSEPA